MPKIFTSSIGGDSNWTLSTNDIYNANSGNVGVGVTTPSAKFSVGATTVSSFTVASTGVTTIIPSTNTAALTITGTNLTSANLLSLSAKNTSGTLINVAYNTATLADALTGQLLDLQTTVTNDAGKNVTALSMLMPATTTSGASTVLKVINITSGNFVNTVGTSTYTGIDLTMPNITQTTGTLTSTGIKITGGTITTGGTNYALITDANAGNVGIGTTTPASNLHIYKNANEATRLKIQCPNTGTSAHCAIDFIGDVEGTNGIGYLYRANSTYAEPTLRNCMVLQNCGPTGADIVFSTANAGGSTGYAERMRIQKLNGIVGIGGVVQVGSSTGVYPSVTTGIHGGAYNQILVHGDSHGLVIERNTVDASNANLTFYHTRNTNASTKTALVSGDGIGQILFAGPTSASLDVYGAGIQAKVNGTVSSGVLPTDLIFSTASTTEAAERMRLGSTGTLLVTKATEAVPIRENIIRAKISDAGNDTFIVANGTTADSIFAPCLVGYCGTSTVSPLGLRALVPSAADASDSSTRGLINIEVFRTDSATDPNNGTLTSIVNRKLLTIHNGSTNIVAISSASNIGIGTAAPINKLDVSGGMVIGSGYAGSTTAPANGLAVEGNVLAPNITSAIKVAFGHLNLTGGSPKVINSTATVPSGAVVSRCVLSVPEAFAGGTTVTFEASLGGVENLVVLADSFDLTVAGQYNAFELVTAGAARTVRVSLAYTGDYTDPADTGEATFIVYYSTPMT